MKRYIKSIIIVLVLSGMFNCSNDLDEVVYSKVTQQSYKYTTDDFVPRR